MIIDIFYNHIKNDFKTYAFLTLESITKIIIKNISIYWIQIYNWEYFLKSIYFKCIKNTFYPKLDIDSKCKKKSYFTSYTSVNYSTECVSFFVFCFFF